MPKKAQKTAPTTDPIVVQGSHSKITYYSDGRIDHEIFWDRLAEDIDHALNAYQTQKTSSKNKVSTATEASSVPNKRSKSSNNKTSQTESTTVRNSRKTKIKAQ